MPRSPRQLAAAARDSVREGARVIHLHVYGQLGRETLDPAHCAEVVKAVHEACPGIPVSLTTSAGIEPDPLRRLQQVAKWEVLPELVTTNQGEEGIVELCKHLISRGVGIEAGLLSITDARAFVRSGLTQKCVRVLIEPLDADPTTALAHAEAMEVVLMESGVALEQVPHGDGIASWAVSERGLRRGHGIRTGLEDTPVLPDGRIAPDNAALVRAAAELMAAVARE